MATAVVLPSEMIQAEISLRMLMLFNVVLFHQTTASCPFLIHDLPKTSDVQYKTMLFITNYHKQVYQK